MYGPLSSGSSISIPSTSARRAFSLSSVTVSKLSSNLGFSPTMPGSPVLPLTTGPGSPGRTARRLSYKLKARAERHIVPLVLVTTILACFFLFYAPHSSHVSLDDASKPHLYARDDQTPFKPGAGARAGGRAAAGAGAKAKSGKKVAQVGQDGASDANGVSLLTQGEDELIAEDDLFWEQYEEAEPLSAEEIKAEEEIKAHRADVLHQNNMGSLRALIWWIAEGGLIPEDWEVPTKNYLKKVGARGMERLLEDIDPGDEGQWIFEDGWADFAKKRYRVVVFSKSYCPYSRNAKSILEKYHISPAPFVVELDQRPDTLQLQSLLMHLTGRRTVPNILFDFDTIGGSDELTLLHAEGGLQRRFEDMELLPGARRRRTPIHPPHVGPAQPAARQDVPADKGNAKVKPRVVQPVEPVAPVPAAPAQAKPEVKKAQEDDVVVPKDVGYDQPAVNDEKTKERLGPDRDDKVKVNDNDNGNGVGKHKAKAGVKADAKPKTPVEPPKAPAEPADANHRAGGAGAPGAIPKGASPEDVRAAIQAAHGTDYLDEAIREQYNVEWDDIAAPLPNDMGSQDAEEFLDAEYAEEYYDDEYELDEDAEALLLEMDDQLQMPMGGSLGSEQVEAFDSVVGPEDIANAPKKPSDDMAGKPMEDKQPEKPAVAAAKAKPVDPAPPPAKAVDKAPAPAKPVENAPAANKAPVPADKGQAKDATAKKADTPKKPLGAKAKAQAKMAERKAAVLAGMKKTADGNGLAGGKKDTVPAKDGKQDEVKRKAGAVPAAAAAAAPVQAKDNANANGRVVDAKRVAKPVEEKAQAQDKARAQDKAQAQDKARANDPATFEQERDTAAQPKDRSDASDPHPDILAKDRLSKDPAERAAQINAQAKAMGAKKMADQAKAKKAENGANARAGAKAQAKARAGAKAKKGKVGVAGAGAAAAKAKKGAGAAAAGAGAKDAPAKKAAMAGGKKRGAVVGKVGGAVAAKKRLNANANKKKLAERKAAVVQGKKKAKILK
ncbi:hypothetical protein EHS25_006480 [Saitozyma podzolica]|uniref:Glutaredoxin domain-containing protein n=1 Tax=Saitozyma podzolica TaxID=1890683 RepID=A0A427YRX5_9TREE|nr:hypothetical protein EHS25_006480 [Saitozyma podzolica]